MRALMLRVSGLNVHYGKTQVLWDISLDVPTGEVVAVMGPNGSGKSSVLKAIIGLAQPSSGRIDFDGVDLTKVPTFEMVAHGISLVLERRRLFPQMTVYENVLMGAYHKAVQSRQKQALEWVNSLFPVLQERGNRAAGWLSGGEQQMVAIARALMSRPRLLLMDEPFLGLSPRMVQEILDLMQKINSEGTAILFNEQNAKLSFSASHKGYLLEGGRVVISGSGEDMLNNEIVQRTYLGAAISTATA